MRREYYSLANIMLSPVPFVEGWNFVQTLGEGAYGEVKLALNAQMNEAVAVKIIELKKAKHSYDLVCFVFLVAVLLREKACLWQLTFPILLITLRQGFKLKPVDHAI